MLLNLKIMCLRVKHIVQTIPSTLRTMLSENRNKAGPSQHREISDAGATQTCREDPLWRPRGPVKTFQSSEVCSL